MLKIRSLSKSYKHNGRRVTAIKNLSVDINEKEFIVFVGPSGCGKTTLLKCIAGLIKPTRGKIIIDSEKISKPNEDVGMVFQDFSLFPWLTVIENVEFGLSIQNVPVRKRRRIVNHYINSAGLNGFGDAYPKSLSGGMKQRVAIARTLACDPKVILMDEPFGALDNLTRKKMQEFLTNLWEQEHKTIIFVTHDVEEALFLADKIYVMGKRPMTIKESFKVPFERPRRHELKFSKEFFEMRNRMCRLLE